MIEELTNSLNNDPEFWNEWETDFIESLKDREWDDLTEKQQEKVQELFDKLSDG